MFGLFKRKRGTMPQAMVDRLIEDTRRTIRAVYEMPPEAQRKIAHSLIRKSDKAFDRVALFHERDRDQVWRQIATEATAQRQAAAMLPGADWSHPEWAFAALYESYMMCNTGAMDRASTEKLSGIIVAMVDDITADGDYGKADEELYTAR